MRHDSDRFRQIADPFSQKSRFWTLFPNGSAVWPRHLRKLRAHRDQSGGMTPSKAPTRRRRAVRGLRMAQNPHHSRLKCAASPTRPGHSTGWRDNAATLKPTTPLRAPEQQPLKPASPLHPTTAAKTPISHPQRRWRFQSHTGTSEQRRRWFQTTGLPRLQHPNAVPVSGGETAAPKFRMQFDWMKFQ